MRDPVPSLLDLVNRTAVLASMGLLGIGLAMWIVAGEPAARRTLDAGLILLMTTPALRLATTVIAEARRQDWIAVSATIGVALVLGWTLILALSR
jgi:hypothetical protein